MTATKAELTALLRDRHELAAADDDDFNVFNQTQLLEAASSISATLTLLLGGIASISLVVGGIGIMNIMLVSVRERTREIGIRKAIGARGRDILAQFLVEALTLSLLGGLIGIVVGLAVSARHRPARRLGLRRSTRRPSPPPSCSASRSASCSASGRHARPPDSIPSAPSATNDKETPRVRRSAPSPRRPNRSSRVAPEPAAVPTTPGRARGRPAVDRVAGLTAARRSSSGRWLNVLLGVAAAVAIGGVAFAVGRSTAPASAATGFGRGPADGPFASGSFDPSASGAPAVRGGHGGAARWRR